MIWMAALLALATPAQTDVSEPAEQAASTIEVLSEEQALARSEALAKEAEESAFAAIEKEDWCAAMNAFLDANAYKESPALIFNAANAAEFAGDSARAKRLFEEFLATNPSGEQKESAAEKLEALSDKSSSTCEMRERPNAPVATPVKVVKAEEKIITPPPPPPAPASISIAPIATTATGGVLLVAGGAATVVGLLPYFGHRTKAAEIVQAEKDGTSAAELQNEQKALREDWESYGEVTFLAGSITAALGVLVVGAGVAWLTLGE